MYVSLPPRLNDAGKKTPTGEILTDASAMAGVYASAPRPAGTAVPGQPAGRGRGVTSSASGRAVASSEAEGGAIICQCF